MKKFLFLFFFVIISNEISKVSGSKRVSTYPVEGVVKVPAKLLKQAGEKGLLGSARVSLNQGEYVTMLRADGSFTLHDIPAGVYTLDVSHPFWVFGQVKIDINGKKNGRVRAILYKYPGAEKTPMKYPLKIQPLGSANYFQPRPVFSILSLLKNPMLLMMGVMGLLAMCMPKLMENMSEEEKAQMQAQMRAMQGHGKAAKAESTTTKVKGKKKKK
eukprot:g3475.t1